MKKLILSTALFMASTVCTLALAGDADHVFFTPDEIAWMNSPPFLPEGAKVAMLYGDPSKAEQFAVRLKMPAGYKIPPHSHTMDENLTVISGTLHIAMGREEDRSHMMMLPQGSFAHMNSGSPHYVRAENEVVVQINGTGPFDIVYVKPSDDPRNQ